MQRFLSILSAALLAGVLAVSSAGCGDGCGDGPTKRGGGGTDAISTKTTAGVSSPSEATATGSPTADGAQAAAVTSPIETFRRVTGSSGIPADSVRDYAELGPAMMQAKDAVSLVGGAAEASKLYPAWREAAPEGWVVVVTPHTAGPNALQVVAMPGTSTLDAVRRQRTAGPKGTPSHDQLVAALEAWDASHGLTITMAGPTGLSATLSKLPRDMAAFVKQAEALAPKAWAPYGSAEGMAQAVSRSKAFMLEFRGAE